MAAGFWIGEMEDELRELEKLDFFGKLKEDDDSYKVLEEIDKIRAKTVYQHTSDECSDICKERGKINILIFKKKRGIKVFEDWYYCSHFIVMILRCEAN